MNEILPILTIVAIVILVFLVGYMVGHEKGYRWGEQSGKFDQHLYNERIKKAKETK